jgi:hypothetical protein
MPAGSPYRNISLLPTAFFHIFRLTVYDRKTHYVLWTITNLHRLADYFRHPASVKSEADPLQSARTGVPQVSILRPGKTGSVPATPEIRRNMSGGSVGL